MGEKILEKTEGRVSYHDSVEEMLIRIREDGLSNVFDRYALQEKIRCKFCLEGLSCKLCSQGPCRISEKGGQTRGVCGIGPDAMAMREFLYITYRCRNPWPSCLSSIQNTKATAKGETPFKIADARNLSGCQNVI